MPGVSFVDVLALGICATLVLYAFIASETSDSEVVDRETAERWRAAGGTTRDRRIATTIGDPTVDRSRCR